MRRDRWYGSRCAKNAEGEADVGDLARCGVVQEMKVVALWRRPAGGGVKPPRAALAEDRRGERRGKGARDASGGDREGERERTADDVSRSRDDIETGPIGCGPG